MDMDIYVDRGLFVAALYDRSYWHVSSETGQAMLMHL